MHGYAKPGPFGPFLDHPNLCTASQSRSATDEREDPPWVRHTLELAGTTVLQT
jgi:hypothetical protein